jgi:hypothetical protein
MLCFDLTDYVKTCEPESGGVSNIMVFDPDDFNFTQAAPIAGKKQPYTAVALRTGATAAEGALMYELNFTRDEAEWTWKQSVKGCAVKYEHSFNFQLSGNSQALTNLLEALDAAACCCGLGMIVRLNNGKIFVAGEKWVNATDIPRFTVLNNGSNGGTGKLYDDPNVGNLVILGSYSRNLYEYTGLWSTIVALKTA